RDVGEHLARGELRDRGHVDDRDVRAGAAGRRRRQLRDEVLRGDALQVDGDSELLAEGRGRLRQRRVGVTDDRGVAPQLERAAAAAGATVAAAAARLTTAVAGRAGAARGKGHTGGDAAA